MKDRIVKKFDNGLKLIYKRDKSKEAVYLELRFFSGLNNDPKDKLGLAHFVEHCAGLSNNKYTRQEKNDYRIKLYYANFSTSRNCMRFYAYVSDEELEDVLVHYVNSISDFTVPQDEFENERKVIKQEILGRKRDLTSEMVIAIREVFYKEIVDSRILPSGTVNSIENITKQDILDYAKKCFVLDNCQITVYGNVSYSRVQKLIKKHLIPALNKSSESKFLKPEELISYSNASPTMVINPPPNADKSRLRAIHKIHLSNIDRFRSYAVSLLNSIFETATHEFFREKYGLCYASNIRFFKSISINNDFDILEMDVVVDCDKNGVKAVLEKLPEFYSFIQRYPINKESVEKAKTTLRRYEKCSSTRNYIQNGESLGDGEFAGNIYYTHKQNQIYKKKREKISVDFVKEVFKQVALTKPFIFILSKTKEELISYDDLSKQIQKNSAWIKSI